MQWASKHWSAVDRGLMVVGIVIGIVLVVLVSITLVYGFSGSRGPKTPK